MNKRLIIIIGVLLIAIPLFLLKSSNINYKEDYPELKVSSSNSLVIKDTVYSFFSKFKLDVEAYGYESKTIEFDHRDADKEIILIEKPIRVIFKINEPYDQFILNNKILTSIDNINLKKNSYSYEIISNNHLTYKSDFEIEKYTEELLIPVILKKIDKSLQISSNPNNAKVLLNNIELGVTPITINLDKSNNEIILKKQGYKDKKIKYSVDNNSRSEIKYSLDEDENLISLSTVPSSASVFLDDEYVGITPIKFTNPNKGVIKIKKYGYLDNIINFSSQSNAINSILKKDMAEVQFDTNVTSKIYLNGRYIGSTPLKTDIQKIKHSIRYEALGYRSIKETFEPLNDNLQIYKTLLTNKQASLIDSKENSTNSIGSKLILMNPGSITMGSPKRESRRDINEIERRVNISKHFFISKNLITHSEFKNYKKSTKASNLPINNISWIDAAKFCNWLSKKEGLEQFYIIKNDILIYYNTKSNGYRLPTEAEWEYAAKSNNPMQGDLIYSWGSDRQITKLVGNIADQSTEGILTNFVADYDDGFVERSPVGSFRSNQNGLNDITGNLSEWVNDFYETKIIDPSKIFTDYIGPTVGTTHVIKGSNHYSSTSLQLGLSYRTYGNGPNELVGFRVARWIY
jgi:formylglycine-generating enzyme required for sulfatase activity